MKILYDDIHDILDMFFGERSSKSEMSAYELRDGIIVFVNGRMQPVQLTLVNFRRLTEIPVSHFDKLGGYPKEEREKLLHLLKSPPISNILRIDPKQFYGHVVSPSLVEDCSF